MVPRTEKKVTLPLLKGFLAMIYPEGQPSSKRGQKQAKGTDLRARWGS